MNADTLESAIAAFVATLRVTIRTEFTSIWLPVQIVAIVLAGLAAVAIGTLLRRRFDLMSATESWPAYLRLAIRALIENFGVLPSRPARRIRAPTCCMSPSILRPHG